MINPASITFDPAAHAYTLAGNPVPSVTSVMEAEGLSGNAYWKEEHRNRGTAVHTIIHLLTRRAWSAGRTAEQIVADSAWDPVRTAPGLVPYGFAAAQYLADSGITPLLAETRVASVIYQIAGTFDFLGALPDGRTIIVDWKSGTPQSAVWIQLNLYALLAAEARGLKVDLLTAVHVKPDGTYKAHPPRPVGGIDLAVGLAAVSLYKWRLANRMLN